MLHCGAKQQTFRHQYEHKARGKNWKRVNKRKWRVKEMGATQREKEVCECVFGPLYRWSALLAAGSGSELSQFRQMERDSPGLREAQRAENSRAGCHAHTGQTHTQTQTVISDVLEHQVASTQALQNTTWEMPHS